jgi:adenylate kinase
VIILSGVAGAGKSVQGKLMADECGFAWISTGEILRVLITGSRRNEMLSGKLLSDQEVIRVVDKVFELIDTKQEFVLDGFPRTTAQADWLMGQVKSGRIKLTRVMNLMVDEDTVRTRLAARGRLDDKSDIVEERFREYHNHTEPILDHFKRLGVDVVNIDASLTPEQVHQEIMSKL